MHLILKRLFSRIMTILGDPNSPNSMVIILMNWKVMIPKNRKVSFISRKKKELYPRPSSSWTNLGFLDFFGSWPWACQKKGFVFPYVNGTRLWSTERWEICYLFTMIVWMALQHLKNKFESQRVSTHKKSIEVDEYVCTLVQQFIFFMSQGLNQDMWFLWPPRVGSLAPRIPMPPIPRFRATLCFRWLILVFLLIGGKLPTLGIFRSRSVKETICFRCSHFHLVFWFGIFDFEARNCCIWKAASTGWGGSWRFNPFMISPLPWSQGSWWQSSESIRTIMIQSCGIYIDPNFRLSLLLVLDCAHG